MLPLDAMFAILVPATLLPLICTLFWAEGKAKRLGIVDEVLAAEGIPREALTSGKLSHLSLLHSFNSFQNGVKA